MISRKIYIRAMCLIVTIAVWATTNIIKQYIEEEKTKTEYQSMQDKFTSNQKDKDNEMNNINNNIDYSGGLDWSDSTKNIEIKAPMKAPVEIQKIEEPKIIYQDKIIDWDGLLEENQETVGWIELTGTNISYPIAQAKNNEKYLNTSFTGRKSDSGAIFSDYRCDFPNNKVIIIHGHNMGNKSTVMFSGLLKLKNIDDIEVRIYLPDGNIKRFEIVDLRGTNIEKEDVIKKAYGINTKNDKEYIEEFIRQIHGLKDREKEIVIDKKQILILNTCIGRGIKEERFLAYCLEKDTKNEDEINEQIE